MWKALSERRLGLKRGSTPIGMIWSECKEIWSDGPREYVMHLWNVLDFGMLSIFVASFTARFMAFLKASKAQQYVDMHVPDEDLSNASLPEEVAYFTYGEQEFEVPVTSAKIHPSVCPSVHLFYFAFVCLVFLLCSSLPTCFPPLVFTLPAYMSPSVLFPSVWSSWFSPSPCCLLLDCESADSSPVDFAVTRLSL